VPPRVAYPRLPTLPAVPRLVDGDRWLHAYDGHSFVRRVQRGGQVMVADVPYFVKAALAGQHVSLRVDAETGRFVVEVDGRVVQHIAIKGIDVGRVSFATFVEHVCAQARTLRTATSGSTTYRRLRR
jgi:hypothetical protein